jgi:glycosyltransferase involved in cell wall biosynthesis
VRLAVDLLSVRAGAIGGVEIYLRELLPRLLSHSDDRVLLLVNSEQVLPVFGDERFDVVRVTSGASTTARARAMLTGFAPVLRDRAVDVLFAPDNFVPLRGRVPVVAVVHDANHLVLPRGSLHRGAAVRRAAFAVTFRRAAHFITPSTTTRDVLVERAHVAPGRVTVVPHGVAVARPDDCALAAMRAQYGLAERPYLLYPAVFVPHKRHVALIDAYAHYRAKGGASELVLTGAAGPSSAAVEQRVRDLGLDTHVRRTGFVARPDLVALLAGASALVYPSAYEGFGMPLLEAMALDVPIVAAPNGALPETGGDAVHYVDATDPSALANAMARIERDETLRARLRERGRARAAAASWDDAARATADVLRRAATSRPHRTARHLACGRGFAGR